MCVPSNLKKKFVLGPQLCFKRNTKNAFVAWTLVHGHYHNLFRYQLIVRNLSYHKSLPTKSAVMHNIKLALALLVIVGGLMTIEGYEQGVAQTCPTGQRCCGRNNGGRGCCTPENPCDEGEGDCDGEGDGGINDGNDGCKPGLVCGRNNCMKFGAYYHPSDDCCERPSASILTPEVIEYYPNAPQTCPTGQRCCGRNNGGRRCCTPENPCDEGEGDCDGEGDGGVNDGNDGCKPGLVCGRNNCQKFGAFYHPSDDCCERPAAASSSPLRTTENFQSGWGEWSEWSCVRAKAQRRTRKCRVGRCVLEANGRKGTTQTQERPATFCASVFLQPLRMPFFRGTFLR